MGYVLTCSRDWPGDDDVESYDYGTDGINIFEHFVAFV